PWLVLGVVGLVLGAAAVLIASGVLDSPAPEAPAAEESTEARALPEEPPEPASAGAPAGSEPSSPPAGSEPSSPPAGSEPSSPPQAVEATAPVLTPDAGPRRAAIPRVKLTISSEPAGAEVFLAGERIGRTPFEHELERGDEAIALEFRRSGFRHRTVRVTPSRDRPVSASLERIPRRPPGKGGGKTTGKGGKSGPPERPTIRKPPPVFVP